MRTSVTIRVVVLALALCSCSAGAQEPPKNSTTASVARSTEEDRMLSPDEQARLLPRIAGELHLPPGTDWAPIIAATRANGSPASLSTWRFKVFYRAKCFWDEEFMQSQGDAKRLATATEMLRWYARQHAFDFARKRYDEIYPQNGPIEPQGVLQEMRTNC